MTEEAHGPTLVEEATALLKQLSGLELRVATAESCTGGLLASLLTDVDGYGECFERGFVVYTDEAKVEMLGVSLIALRTYGAVSRPVAHQMAIGALERSNADLAVAITGFAGPAGKRDEEGLVFLEVHSRRGKLISCQCHYGSAGRDRVRNQAASRALEMLRDLAARI